MLKLLLRVLLEVVVGIMAGGVVLAISIPLLMKTNVLTPNDLAGTVFIVGILVASVGWMLLRPGSAMNNHFK